MLKAKALQRHVCSVTLAALAALGIVSPVRAAASLGAPAAVGADYRIRPGDVLDLTVFGEPTLSQPTLKVLPGGGIVAPLAGQVRVGGLTPPQASNAIAAALSKYLKHPKVALAVALVGPLDVYVLGNVKTPGKYQLQPSSKLMDALAAAGGLGPVDGDLPAARISLGDQTKSVPLQPLLHGGDLSQNVPVENQMTVYVPSPVTFNVQVLGAVDKPGDVAMHEGDRLGMAIARAGNSPNANSDLNHVVVRRTDAEGKVTTQTVNMYDIYKNGDVTKDLVLQKNDYVYVPQGSGKHNVGDNPITGIFRRIIGF